jgi:hypothetical protein
MSDEECLQVFDKLILEELSGCVLLHVPHHERVQVMRSAFITLKKRREAIREILAKGGTQNDVEQYLGDEGMMRGSGEPMWMEREDKIIKNIEICEMIVETLTSSAPHPATRGLIAGARKLLRLFEHEELKTVKMAEPSYPEEFIKMPNWWFERKNQEDSAVPFAEVWDKFTTWMAESLGKDPSKFAGNRQHFFAKVSQWVIKGQRAPGHNISYEPNEKLLELWGAQHEELKTVIGDALKNPE